MDSLPTELSGKHPSTPQLFSFFKIFYQNIVDNNVVVISSAQQSDSVVHTYTYIYILFPTLFPNRLLQNIEYSPRCYTVGVSTLYIVVCIFNLSLSNFT